MYRWRCGLRIPATKDELKFTTSSIATADEIFTKIEAALAALGERLDTQGPAEWIHVYGPLIRPGCELIKVDELAAAQAVREIDAEKKGRW